MALSFKQRANKIKSILKITTKSLKYFFKANPRLMTLHIGLNLLRQPIPLLVGYLTGLLIDKIILTVQTDAPVSDIYPLVFLIFVIAFFSTLLSKLTHMADQRVNLFMDFQLDKDMLLKYASLDLSVFEDPKMSNSMAKISRNAGRLFRLTDNTVYLIPNLLIIGLSLAIFARLSPTMLLIIFVTSAPVFFEEIFYGKRIWGIWDANAEYVRDYSDTFGYVRSDKSISEVRTFGLVKYLTTKAITTYEGFLKQQLDVETKRLKLGTIFSVISSIGTGLTFFLISTFAIVGKITIGSIAFYIQSARSLADSVSYSLQLFAGIADHSAYAEEFFEIMEYENKLLPGTKKLPQSLKPPVIEFKNVTFRYPNTEKDILYNFSLNIEPGQNIAIVGKNGAGKTTLIKLLLRLYDVTEGEILINNVPIKELDLEDLYKHVATLFQQFNMYHYDAKTNIGLGNVDKLGDVEGIYKSAKMSGANEFIEKYENGYDQVLNKRYTDGIEPSYGQWQKIALARAFFRDPDILILDEPTSAIDPKAEFEIFERLFDFAENKTIIIISHRFSTVRNASRIIVLDEGKIIEDGTHEELMQINEGVYKTAFEIQRKGYE